MKQLVIKEKGWDNGTHTVVIPLFCRENLYEAKSAILSWFLENLPKKYSKNTRFYPKGKFCEYEVGWNECLAEIKRSIGAKERYGRIGA